MTDREIMQMALDALEHGLPIIEDFGGKEQIQIQHKAISALYEALRARLAQPEQEPFEYWNAVEGWVKIDEVRQHFDTAGCGTIYKTAGEGRVPLYVAREWQGLTDDDFIGLTTQQIFAMKFAEAKLRGKNT